MRARHVHDTGGGTPDARNLHSCWCAPGLADRCLRGSSHMTLLPNLETYQFGSQDHWVRLSDNHGRVSLFRVGEECLDIITNYPP